MNALSAGDTGSPPAMLSQCKLSQFSRSRDTIAAIIQLIVASFQPTHFILFGSVARGEDN